MTVTVRIFPDEQLYLEIPDVEDDELVVNNQRLSQEEFEQTLKELVDLSSKIHPPDAKPLSDYAMNRESIYEGHPKL